MVDEPTSLLKPDDYEWSWTDFDDWNVNDHMKGIPWDLIYDISLSPSQKNIVKRNCALLKNNGVFDQKIIEFELLLSQEINVEARERKRDEYQIRFDNATINFLGEVLDYSFPCRVIFNKTEFLYDIYIEGTKFKHGVEFKGAIFHQLMTIQHNCIFKNQVRFDGAIFKQDFRVEHIKFEDWVTFERAEFHGEVNFRNVKFQSTLQFFNSIFRNRVHFENVTVQLSLGFQGAKFDKQLVINGGRVDSINSRDTFIGGNLVLRSSFRVTDFKRLNVKGTTNLSGCQFETVPDFRDSNLECPPEVAGMTMPPPDMVFKIKNEQGDAKFLRPFKLAEDSKAVAKYRKLKAMAIAANDHEKDGEFFAYEMMAKRGHETKGFFPLLLNSLYWLLSYYGHSIARPFLAMISSWVFFWLLAIGLTTPQMGTLKAFSFSALHSLFNIVPLIGGLFRSAAMPKGHETWYDKTYHELIHDGFNANYLTAFSTVQQFLGIIFLFLLVLGLRNKFRLK